MIDTEALRELAEQTGVTIHEGQTLNEAADALDAMRWRKEPPDITNPKSEGYWAYINTHLATSPQEVLYRLWWDEKESRMYVGDSEKGLDYPADSFEEFCEGGEVAGDLWLKLPDPEGT